MDSHKHQEQIESSLETCDTSDHRLSSIEESSKWRRLKNVMLETLREIKVEPYMFFMMMSLSISMVTVQQLIQDKMCKIYHHETDEFCRNLGKSPDSPTKSKILSNLVTFNVIQTILDSLPGIIWALMIGSLCDKYIHGRKIIMILASLSSLIKMVLLILNSLYFSSWGMFLI